jgi:DNA-binding CsgD family transcriptional regulator
MILSEREKQILKLAQKGLDEEQIAEMLPIHFTKREKDIIKLIKQHLSNSEIANTLYISRKTVEIHRSHINHKLGLHSPRVLLSKKLEELGY